MEWAAEKIRLSNPVEGGSKDSKEEHLRKVWKATGSMPEELSRVERIPQHLLYLWQWFNEIGIGFSFSELESWQRIRGINLSQFEIDILLSLGGKRLP